MADDANGFDVDVQDLAAWLRRHAADSWWTVDGDTSLASAIDLPCRGDELAEVLASHGGRVRIFAPSGTNIASMPEDLGALAEIGEDGARGFLLAWLAEDQRGESWVLAEDIVARHAFEEAVAE